LLDSSLVVVLSILFSHNKLLVEPIFETVVYHVTRPKKIEKSGHFFRPNASIHDEKTMPSPNVDLGTILIIFRVFLI
jgi:hypothetical protein